MTEPSAGSPGFEFARELLEFRRVRSAALPVRAELAQFADELLELLFPHFSDAVFYLPEDVEGQLRLLQRNLKKALGPLQPLLSRPIDEIAAEFFARIPQLHRMLWQDACAMHEGDPAAESVDEVIAAYPGFLAIATFRIAHEFYLLRVPFFPRVLTEHAHQRTGIDIHPGARIGQPFFIDHGTGVVIGESTIIGNHVKIYQGVTLGAVSVDKALSRSKRHPTIEDRVVIYSNATILGGSTIIGHDSIIGGNVWLNESVPPFSLVFQKSEVKVRNTRPVDPALDFVI